MPNSKAVFKWPASPGNHSAAQTLFGVTVHTPLRVRFYLFSYLHVSPVCFVWSPDPWPTVKQLPACLSTATKLLYIMAWSPATQRGFMAGARRMVSAEPRGLTGESCAFAANKSATEQLYFGCNPTMLPNASIIRRTISKRQCANWIILASAMCFKQLYIKVKKLSMRLHNLLS